MTKFKFARYARFTPVLASCFLLIQGCASPNIESRNGNDVSVAKSLGSKVESAFSQRVNNTTVGTSAYADAMAAKQIAQSSGAVTYKATKPWVGTRTIAIQSDDMLPAAFGSIHQINFDDAQGGRVSINVVAERLSRLAGIPVRVKGDVFIASGTSPQRTPATAQMPAPPMPMPGVNANAIAPIAATQATTATAVASTDLSSIEMRWNGTLSGYLDHVTGRLGVSWSYRDGVILIERYVTETFEIAAFMGSQDYKMNMNGTGGGSAGTSGASSSTASGMDISESGKMDVLTSLNKTITAMAATIPGSSVTLSEGSASIVVTTTKDVMGRIRQVIKSENASMMRSVQIQFDIYSVMNNESNESGINLNLLMQSLTDGTAATLLSPSSLTTSVAGGLSVSLFNSNNTFAKDSAAMLKALNEFGTSAQHRPLSFIVMNRQWARKTNLKQTGYLQETTPAPASSAGAGGLPGLKTGTVTTGDTLAVQPAIMNNGNVILKFGVGLTDLLGLFDVTTGSGATFQKVQTPEVSGTNDQGTVTLKAGEVMVLTGMSRLRMNNATRSLHESLSPLIGGSKTGTRTREDFIIVVRPVLL